VPQNPTLSAEKIKSPLTLVVLLKPFIIKANRRRLRSITIKEKVTKSSLNRLNGGFFLPLKPFVYSCLLTMPGIPGWAVTLRLIWLNLLAAMILISAHLSSMTLRHTHVRIVPETDII